MVPSAPKDDVNAAVHKYLDLANERNCLFGVLWEGFLTGPVDDVTVLDTVVVLEGLEEIELAGTRLLPLARFFAGACGVEGREDADDGGGTGGDGGDGTLGMVGDVAGYEGG